MLVLLQRSIATQVRLALGLLSLLAALAAGGLLLAAHRASENVARLYRAHLAPVQQLVEIHSAYAVDLTSALRAVRGGHLSPEEGLELLVARRARAAQVWAEYRAGRPETAEVREAGASLERLQALCEELARLLPAGPSPALGIFGDEQWLPEVVDFSHRIDALRQEQDRQARALTQELEASTNRSSGLGVALVVATFAAALWFGARFSKRLERDTNGLLLHLQRVAEGDFSPMPVEAGDSELVRARRELGRTVSRLQQLMAALRAQQAREQALLDCAPAAIIGLDLQGRVSHFSAGAEKMLGYRAEEMIEKASPMLWRLPDELEALARDVSARLGRAVAPGVEALQAAATIPGFTTECHYKARDGTLIPVLLNIAQIRGAGGELLGSMGVALDLRDVKRLRDELRASEERYRLLAERLPDIVFQSQSWPDGRRTWPFVSPQFERFYGIDGSVLARNPDYSLEKVHPDDRAGYLRCLENAAARLAPMEWEGRSYTERPGELRWIRVRRSPTPQPDGSLLWEGVLEDITKVKLAEEALRQSEARALEATRAKSAFVANMSHELRTPLNSIIGFAGILHQGLTGPLNPEQKKQLGMVRDSAAHLLNLINDVLDFSKVEAGQLTVTPAPFDLGRSIERVVRSVLPLANKKGLRLDWNVDPSLGVAIGDARRVEQVVLNLVSNAIKFTEAGGVEVSAAPRDGLAEVRVKDSGIGIKPEDLPALFLPFSQIETGLARRYEGTGLGLSICKHFVELLGGTIRVESAWGRGSTFSFTIPLQGTAPSVSGGSPRAPEGALTSSSPGRAPSSG